MSEQDRSIERFRGQLAFVLTCKYALALMTAWAFLWGTAVFLLRATTDVANA